jgi:uncharacterized repeat protein (TIGR01451 family)
MQTIETPHFFVATASGQPRRRHRIGAAAALLCLALLGIGANTVAAEAPAAHTPLASELALSRIVVGADGKEALQPAAKVQPGDTVHYSVVYRNQGKTALANVVASLPVPQGMQIVPPQADELLASVDGKTFARLPLMHKVQQADGRWQEVPVPLADIRYVRWPARSLAAGEQFNANLRVRVTAVGS